MLPHLYKYTLYPLQTSSNINQYIVVYPNLSQPLSLSSNLSFHLLSSSNLVHPNKNSMYLTLFHKPPQSALILNHQNSTNHAQLLQPLSAVSNLTKHRHMSLVRSSFLNGKLILLKILLDLSNLMPYASKAKSGMLKAALFINKKGFTLVFGLGFLG